MDARLEFSAGSFYSFDSRIGETLLPIDSKSPHYPHSKSTRSTQDRIILVHMPTYALRGHVAVALVISPNHCHLPEYSLQTEDLSRVCSIDIAVYYKAYFLPVGCAFKRKL